MPAINQYPQLKAADGASNVNFTQAVSNATPRSVQDKLRDVVSVKDFGAVGNGIADDTIAIQNAINAVRDIGGGYVHIPTGTYIITDTLTIYSKVILEGEGESATEIRLANNVNKTIIKSEGYDSLVGTDTWLVASGNKYAYGLMNLRLNGNKANQSAGYGVQFYGKRLFIENVMIVQCKEEGWHSESNYTIPGMPASNGEDMPEGRIVNLKIWECGSHGFVFRGQHDTYIESLFVGVCGGWGVRFESDTIAPGVYSGNCDAGFMHIYANTLGGVFVGNNATHQCAFMITESNFGVGFECDGWQVKVGTLQAYGNCRTSGSYQVIIDGSESVLSGVHVKSSGPSGTPASGGVQINGSRNHVTVTAIGEGSTGTGVDVNGGYNHVNAIVRGYSGAGGRGLRTGAGSQLVHSFVFAKLEDCATLWNNASTGSLNSYSITGFANLGQTVFSGNGPNVNLRNESWDVKFNANGTVVYSSRDIRSINAINLNSTLTQTITIAHGLLLTPVISACQVSLAVGATGSNWAIQHPLYIKSVDATNIVIEGKLSTAEGSALNGDIVLSVSI